MCCSDLLLHQSSSSTSTRALLPVKRRCTGCCSAVFTVADAIVFEPALIIKASQLNGTHSAATRGCWPEDSEICFLRPAFTSSAAPHKSLTGTFFTLFLFFLSHMVSSSSVNKPTATSHNSVNWPVSIKCKCWEREKKKESKLDEPELGTSSRQ